jgi:CAP-Gly domain-containing linker protein 1
MSLENSPPKSSSQLEMDGNALQDKINQLMSGRQTPSSPSIKRGVLPRSQSSQSWAQGIEDPTEEIERLRSRLESLEYENKSLREVQEHELAAADDRKLAKALAANEADRAELDETKIRISELEGFLRNSERSTHERDSKIEALERTVQSISSDFSKLQADSESRARGFREDLESNEALVLSLKEAIAAREGAAAESDAVAAAKDAEVASLQSKLARTQAELDEERRELGAQVDELRHAGQETIALYEERLSSADVIRYELEDALAAAKDELRTRAKEPPASPGTAARRAVSAAEIDNEALREQVQHLQKQLAQLEDQLDDVRADAERGEAAVEDRARRHKDREEAHAKDLEVAHGEIEDLRKAEERAKSKVLDLEDAVREGAEALENARAEIEGLRAEVGVCAKDHAERLV